MHSFTHSLAHRAPPASRTRGRWQPYAALQSASSSTSSSSSSSSASSTFSARVSPANYLTANTTPATSATSSPASSEADLSRPKDSSREGNKTKYALSLVDQSVKSLCDIWRPQDIPAVYGSVKASDANHAAFASQQRLAPSTSSSPSSLLAHHRLAAPSQPSIPTAPVLIQTGTADAQPPLVPVRGFVHEVLKRSRTSGGVLQTALCYLEAIRPKLADLIHQEKEGTAVYGEPEPTSTITPATEEEIAREAELAQAELDLFSATNTSATDTIRVDDNCELESPLCPDVQPPSPPKPSAIDFAPLPLLPSPLLCPRRSFLAALILASKFTQDKCYSNRAWAKLSGLSPREIGRCERALGDALDWRLWVGKAAAPAVPATSRPLARSQSEPSIFSNPPDGGATASTSGLRRASTLPDIFPQLPPMEKQQHCIPTDVPLYLQPTPKPALTDNGITPTGCSPLSDVPSLSYSPSSTESSSSSGERTIQMSTFLEDNMVPPGACETTTQSWPWLDSESGAISANASFAMNVDGLPIKGVWYGKASMSLAASSSPVAKINGKLLAGNGLHAFQHLQTLPVGSFGDLTGHNMFIGSGVASTYDSYLTTSVNALDVSSMG